MRHQPHYPMETPSKHYRVTFSFRTEARGKIKHATYPVIAAEHKHGSVAVAKASLMLQEAWVVHELIDVKVR